MNRDMKHLVLWLAVAVLLAPVVPTFAQGTSGFDYRFEGLAIGQPAGAPPAMLRVGSGQMGFQLASDQLDLTGTVRCATADAGAWTVGWTAWLSR